MLTAPAAHLGPTAAWFELRSHRPFFDLPFFDLPDLPLLPDLALFPDLQDLALLSALDLPLFLDLADFLDLSDLALLPDLHWVVSTSTDAEADPVPPSWSVTVNVTV